MQKTVLSTVKLFREMEGRLLETTADLSKTLFFKVPLDSVKDWN